VIPAVEGRKRGGSFLGADADALASINMKNAIVNRLLLRVIRGKVRVVEMRRIMIGEHNHQRSAPGLQVRFD
jgi:hypothetical protein